MTAALPRFVLAGATALFGLSVAAGQGGAPAPSSFPQPPYRNLKVFPATITSDQLQWNMNFFAKSLGVRCTHCHVRREGEAGGFDFASDAKPEKLTARKMLEMTHRINRVEFGVAEFRNVKVTCFTCHRGQTKPPAFPPPESGAPAPSASQPRAERG